MTLTKRGAERRALEISQQFDGPIEVYPLVTVNGRAVTKSGKKAWWYGITPVRGQEPEHVGDGTDQPFLVSKTSIPA